MCRVLFFFTYLTHQLVSSLTFLTLHAVFALTFVFGLRFASDLVSVRHTLSINLSLLLFFFHNRYFHPYVIKIDTEIEIVVYDHL